MDQFSHDTFAAAIGDDAAPSASDRRNLRDSLFLAADVTIDGEMHQVRVRNLSSGGLMADFAKPVVIGTAVAVDLRGIGRVGGRIAWAAEGRIGVALDLPIDPLAARKPVSPAAKRPVRDRPIKPLF